MEYTIIVDIDQFYLIKCMANGYIHIAHRLRLPFYNGAMISLSICRELFNLTSIKILNINGADIKKIYPMIKNLKKLERLFISATFEERLLFRREYGIIIP